MTVSAEVRDQLIARAIKAREKAYAPYSHYRVGSALLTASGKIFDGVNVENAAYPTGMCAERVAVFKAVSEGEVDFLAIVVVTDNGGSPCGACRQVISEFGMETMVYIASTTGEVIAEGTIADMLPAAFRPKDLVPE
ncbi:MAG: cytidine deaminase [Anaerolineaceae bacterium]